MLALVLLTHYGYPFIASATDEPEKWASWAFYVLRGIEGTALLYLVMRLFPGRLPWAQLGIGACWLGMFEESQTAVCGLMASGAPAPDIWGGLCVEQFGILPYMAVFAACVAILIKKGTRARGPETG